jgi:prolyl-tRNA synthetase
MAECEAKVKEETKFTSRNIPFEPPVTKHKCVSCGMDAKHTVWFARAY